MTDKLKPCPFCGQNVLEVCISPTNKRKKYIRCCSDVCAYGAYTDKEEMKSGWNTRPIEDALNKEINQLKQDNQDLVAQINSVSGKLEKAIEMLQIKVVCPTGVDTDCNNTTCIECWKRYFEGEKP